VNDEVQKVCPVCGVAYCLPARFDAERREDHKTWWCPNGHGLSYKTESPKERVIRELRQRVRWLELDVDSRNHRIGELEHELRSLRSRLAWARRRAA
jgi:hypothetical protein